MSKLQKCQLDRIVMVPNIMEKPVSIQIQRQQFIGLNDLGRNRPNGID
ncbi:hypothetical protein P7L88_04035 [Bisgaard Taxon 10/6]|nr:hypothetical protein [Exercitatus varius]MDG2947698.1 hypothetical protein [Exercitatus varius]